MFISAPEMLAVPTAAMLSLPLRLSARYSRPHSHPISRRGTMQLKNVRNGLIVSRTLPSRLP